MDSLRNYLFETFSRIYGYLVHSIRTKLVVITSLLVLFSINILVYITLIIFEENITNMVTFLHSKSTKILSESVHSNLLNYFDKLKQLKTNTSSKLSGKKYDDILAHFSFERTNQAKGTAKYNDKLMQGHAATEKDLYKFISHKAKNIVHTCQNVFVIENISKKFGQPLWMTYNCSEKYLYLSVVKFQAMREKFGENDSDADSGTASFLVNGKGDVIFHSNKNSILEEINLAKYPIVEKMFKGVVKNSVVHFKDTRGDNFGAFERMDDIQFGLVAIIPEEIALEGVSTVRWGSFLVTMAVLSGAILLIYYFSNTISNPIKNLVEATKRIKSGNYQQAVKAVTSDEIGTLTNSFNQMAEGLGEREKLKGALGKFVNEEIARQVLEGDVGLGGKRSEATIFFSDIRSFTAISEAMEPEGVVEFLNEYMTLMVSIIHKTGGVVDKYIGDAIMAVWGTPVKKGNDVANCLDATLQMRSELIKLNIRRKEKGTFPINIGCGVNTGPVLSGQIGSPERLEYTVIGDSVNLASRVEALSKPFAVDILITDNTYQKIKENYNVVKMPNVSVKGKTQVQKVYTLLSKKGDKNAPKTLAQLRKMVGITREPVTGSAALEEERKYEIEKK